MCYLLFDLKLVSTFFAFNERRWSYVIILLAVMVEKKDFCKRDMASCELLPVTVNGVFENNDDQEETFLRLEPANWSNFEPKKPTISTLNLKSYDFKSTIGLFVALSLKLNEVSPLKQFLITFFHRNGHFWASSFDTKQINERLLCSQNSSYHWNNQIKTSWSCSEWKGNFVQCRPPVYHKFVSLDVFSILIN